MEFQFTKVFLDIVEPLSYVFVILFDLVRRIEVECAHLGEIIVWALDHSVDLFFVPILNPASKVNILTLHSPAMLLLRLVVRTSPVFTVQFDHLLQVLFFI